VAGVALQVFAQVRDLAPELSLPQSIAQRDLELRFGERLGDEINRAELHGLHHCRSPALARQHHNGDVAIDAAEGCEGRKSVRATGQDEIENHGRRRCRLE
jgi:hypothetical protein